MKKIKKLLALVMAMTMVLGMSVTVSAADTIVGNNDDTGVITIKGLTPEDGITVKAYKIIEAKYDLGYGNFTGYDFLYEDVVEETITDYEKDIDQDVLNEILADIHAENPLVTPQVYSMDKPVDGDGSVYQATVPVGSYLVVVEGAEAKVYNPVVISVSYVNEDGTTDLSEGIVGVSDPNNGWVKVSSVPTIDKTVSDTSGDDETGVKGDSVNVGDNVTYTVTIDPIPNYGGDYPVLNVVDTLSDGLAFVENSLSVKVIDSETKEETSLVSGTHYTFMSKDELAAQEETGTFKVDFVVDNEYMLNDYVGDKVVITYNATVTSNAVVNAGGNNNNAVLNFTTDSKTDGNGDTDEDKTYTYTFDIDGSTTGTKDIITKVGEGEHEEALRGAVFGLYTDPNCTKPYTNDSDTLNPYVKDGETLVPTANTVTSNEEGQLHISGLAAGTYYLKELYAPEGYSVNTHVFEIIIGATYDDYGKLTSWSVEIDDQEVASFTVDHTSGVPVVDDDITGEEIKNTKIPSLPSTGGIGTTIFTIGGCVIMIAAAALFFVNRRKSEEN